MKASLNQIFTEVQMMNPSVSMISSIGSFVTNQSEQVAQMVTDNIVKFLPSESLAYKIARNTLGRLTDKQLWVICYELLKNETYCEVLGQENAKISAISSAKYDASKAKLAANKSASSEVLSEVKLAGKKLGDYYIWLKSSSFKKEFFNKKYSSSSVQSFISL